MCWFHESHAGQNISWKSCLLECCPVNVFNSRYAISEYFGWLSSFLTSFVTSVAFLITTVAVHCGSFRRIDLPSIILSTVPCFEVGLSSNPVKKKVFICWLLTLFKSAKKNDNNRDHTHITQSYWRLDTLPTIFNSWYRVYHWYLLYYSEYPYRRFQVGCNAYPMKFTHYWIQIHWPNIIGYYYTYVLLSHSQPTWNPL